MDVHQARAIEQEELANDSSVPSFDGAADAPEVPAGPIPRGRVGRATKWVARQAVPWLLPVVLVLAWYVTSRNSTAMYYPPLASILDEFRESFVGTGLRTNVLPSLWMLAQGFALAAVMGMGVGYPLGLTRAGRAIFMPVLDLFRSTPVIALIPPFIAIFGIGRLSEVLLIAWSAVWPILLSTIDGVVGLEAGFRDTGRVLRMSRWQEFRLIRLPAAAPRIMVGVNTATSIAITAMVAIEMFSATHGMGLYLTRAQRDFDISGSFAGALATGVFGFAISGALHVIERRWLLAWHAAARKRTS
ncbi:ABC transporter permease [Streptomyces chartreusis]|uniref:ABC transporter permease n=1 Tax=Streptomyces chartreusis TaxID=1969 RepID=UPI0036C6867A